MREIEFRGRKTFSKEWVYGNLITDKYGRNHIVPVEYFDEDGHHLSYDDDTDEPVFIDQETLGQFTGFLDNKEKKIFEGDPCDVHLADGSHTIAHVYFIDGCFELWFISPVVINGEYRTRDYLKCYVVNHAVEVIGKKYEVPEILEETK